MVEPGTPTVVRMVATEGVEATLAGVLAVGDARHHHLSESAVAQRLIDAAAKGIRYVIPGDDEWPTQLDRLAGVSHAGIAGVPLGLWVKGPARLDEQLDSVAVVGSRTATSYGADVAVNIAATISRSGRTVVSGAAFGIDQAAHRGALANERVTIAVLACGVDRSYPTAHAPLVDCIAQTGAVVSEVPLGWAPSRTRFLARNRLIAALSCGMVVVEAAVRSGALNAAAWSSGIGSPVYGVPGPVTGTTSQGVHQLIRTGAATLVTSGEDALEALAVLT